MGILSDYEKKNRVPDIDIPEIQFPDNTEENTIEGAGQQKITAPPDAALPEIPRVDIPFQDIEFDTSVPVWQSAPPPEATMPGGSSTNIALPFLQNAPASQILNPINQRDQNGAYRNPVLEGLADLFGVRKGYEEYYQKNYGQLGLAGPLFYLLSAPLSVGTGVGADLGRIGAAYKTGMERSTTNFYKNLAAGQNLGQLGRNALKDYVAGYGELLSNTDDGKDYTFSQRSLLGNTFSFSDERINKEGKFSPYGLLPDYGTYKRAPDLKRKSTSARNVRTNEALNNLAGLVGIPAQVALDIVTGQGLGGKQSLVELPRLSDWLADRFEQAEQDPKNYYKGLAGLGLDAIFDGFITDVPGYVRNAVGNSIKARTSIPAQPGALAPLNRGFQFTPSGRPPLNTGRPRASRQPVFRETPIDVEFRDVTGQVLPPAREQRALPGQRALPEQRAGSSAQRSLPGQPMLPPTGDRVPFNPVTNPPRPPRIDLVPELPLLQISGQLSSMDDLRALLSEPDVNSEIRIISRQDILDTPVQGLEFDSFIFDDPAVFARIDASDIPEQTDSFFDELESGLASVPDDTSLNSLFRQADEIGQRIEPDSVVPDNSSRNIYTLLNEASSLGVELTAFRGSLLDRFPSSQQLGDFLNNTSERQATTREAANTFNITSEEYIQLAEAVHNDNFYGGLKSLLENKINQNTPEFVKTGRQSGLSINSYPEYGQNTYSVSQLSSAVRFTDFVKWFKQTLNDPEFNGKSLILYDEMAGSFTQNIPGRSDYNIIFDGANIRVGRILEKLGWDANWQFGYARFDNINVRGVQDTIGEIVNPALRKDRMRWKTDNYIKQLSDFFGAPKGLWYGEKFNQMYGQITDLRTDQVLNLADGEIPQNVFDGLYLDIVSVQQETAQKRIIKGFIRDNYPIAFENLSEVRMRNITDYITDNIYSQDSGLLSRKIAREARDSQIDNDPGVQQLISDIATPNVLRFELEAMAVIKQLPPDMRGSGTEYRYTLQELINSDTELENALSRINAINDAYAELSQDIEFRPPTGAESYNPEQQSAIFPTREINAELKRGDNVTQNITRANSMARQPVPAPKADRNYGAPSIIMYDTENIRMMDLESFGGLQEQFDSMREQFDPETFDSVYEQILEGLANDFDILPDGTVINPELFIETLRQPVRDTNNAVELRVESFNASPNPVSAGDVQAQLLDELEQQLETGYEALDDAFNRNEYAEDTLRDIVEQQRESFFSNDEDFPVRSTSESYENRLEALTQNIQNIEQMSQQVVELRNELSEVLQSRRGETSAQEVISAFTRATRETRKDLDISGITLEKDAFVAAHPEFIDEINEIYELMREGIEETRIFFEETGINLQVIADASISVRRNFIEYADELQEAMLDSDPDALIDAAVAYRENHNQLWNEATALYENATAVFIQANQEQGIWVPADIFPLLEDIC